MNRGEFLGRLERGLGSLPPERRAEILDDYRSYFADGIAAGRTEQEVAESLGSPARLAIELALEFEVASPPAPGTSRAVVRRLAALVALVMLQGLAWLPLVAGLLLVLVLIGAGITGLVYGVFTLIVSPFDMPLGGITAVLLRGLAYLSAAGGALAAARAGVLVLVKFFVRLHRRARALHTTTEVSP